MEKDELEAYNNTVFSSKEILELYLPSIIPLMTEGSFPWRKVDNLLKRRMDSLIVDKKIFNEGIEFSIFEILIMYQMIIHEHERKGNINLEKGFTIAEILPHCNDIEARYIAMQQFLLDLFGELAKRLDRKETLLIRRTLFSVFTNFDSKYLNFVGEVAVLSLLKKSDYKLLGVEIKISNAKPIDFKFYKPATERYFNIEVVNIHVDSSKLGSAKEIEKFLKGRVVQKLKSKINNIKQPAFFYLIPVLWGNIEALRKIQSLFIKTPLLLGNRVLEPLTFVIKRNNSRIFTSFGRISTLNLEDGSNV